MGEFAAGFVLALFLAFIALKVSKRQITKIPPPQGGSGSGGGGKAPREPKHTL